MKPDPALAPFRRGAVDLIDERELAARLAGGRKLRVKFGMDPTSPDLHLGHAIPLMKLRDLQEAGHQVVLIVGDATAMVGDPSGRNKLRPPLSRAEVEAHLATYTAQAGRILDLARTEVRRNSEWFDCMRFEELLRLAGRMTVSRMLERDTFQERVAAGEPIGIHEFLYPLMQGWDSVMIRCDVELGGTDQLFNLHAGRHLQQQEGQAPQVILTTPLIHGLDGRKMSKSYGNAVGLADEPGESFGRIMSLPDAEMAVWFEQLTRLAPERVVELLAGSLRDAKAELAEEIVAGLHGRAAARAARAAFDRRFRDRELPAEIPEISYPGEWPAAGIPVGVFLRQIGFAASSSEARQLVAGGGVKLDGALVKDPKAAVPRPAAPLLVQVGKRRVARVRP
jgi:tyrosyl-tRNA synthetase